MFLRAEKLRLALTAMPSNEYEPSLFFKKILSALDFFAVLRLCSDGSRFQAKSD